MKQFCEHLVSLLLVYIYLSGCSALPIAEGQVLALSQQVTMQGVYAALNGAQPAARFFVKENLGVIAWPQSGGWAWVCIQCSAKDPMGMFYLLTGGKGNIANAGTVSGMAKFLLDSGWTELAKNMAPKALLAGQNAGAFLSTMGSSITGFMVVPVMPAPIEIRETVKG